MAVKTEIEIEADSASVHVAAQDVRSLHVGLAGVNNLLTGNMVGGASQLAMAFRGMGAAAARLAAELGIVIGLSALAYKGWSLLIDKLGARRGADESIFGKAAAWWGAHATGGKEDTSETDYLAMRTARMRREREARESGAAEYINRQIAAQKEFNATLEQRPIEDQVRWWEDELQVLREERELLGWGNDTIEQREALTERVIGANKRLLELYEQQAEAQREAAAAGRDAHLDAVAAATDAQDRAEAAARALREAQAGPQERLGMVDEELAGNRRRQQQLRPLAEARDWSAAREYYELVARENELLVKRLGVERELASEAKRRADAEREVARLRERHNVPGGLQDYFERMAYNARRRRTMAKTLEGDIEDKKMLTGGTMAEFNEGRAAARRMGGMIDLKGNILDAAGSAHKPRGLGSPRDAAAASSRELLQRIAEAAERTADNVGVAE